MKLVKIATLGTLALSIAGLSACNNMMPTKSPTMKAPMHSQATASMNVVQIAQSNPDFSLLVEAVAAAMAEDRGTLEDVIEPYLIQQGYVLRTARGRVLTQMAIDQML